MNDMKELAFQTTSTADEAVGSPKSPDSIDSAITINSTFADRDAKTVNQTQLQEDTKLPEIINIQNTELCTGIFDQAAIANQDTTEEEMRLDRLAMVDQDFKCTLPLIHFKGFAVWTGEYARMTEDEQLDFRHSIYEYCEKYIEATQPQAFLRKFNCFPKLPLELRRQIWFHALPEPCLVELNIYKESDHITFLGGPELVAAKIGRVIKSSRTGNIIPSQLLLGCRESHDFFLEHYSLMDLQSLAGNEIIADGTANSRHSIYHASSRGYIDSKSDTEVEYFIDPNNGWGRFGGLPSHQWKHIETLFPHLKQLNFIQNTCRDMRSVNQGELDFSPLSINCLQPINADFIDSPLECITKGHYHEDHDDFVRKLSIKGQSALNHSMVYKSQYLERVQNNPGYWRGIEFETSLLINFQPDYDFYIINRNFPNQKDQGGDSRLLITRAESCRGTISLFFEGWMDNLPVYNDEAFYNGSSGKEQHEEHESATRYDYDKRP
ncbi:hypothetical protein BCON_0379g00020 [Botryotinia convoluta]|uniref:2EXR domain-containing protein n=1 Tax=Botryotinia convoluta TaxID=54673 RepID=A0A4Z1H9X1_9HELO|nr:hypothetical protein BCON_0379g00020 [Botryotinia convoluta]